MIQITKKIIISAIFNTSFFLILLVGIQNSENKSKVKFFSRESIDLPISFIIGSSFIAGSISGSFFSLINYKKE